MWTLNNSYHLIINFIFSVIAFVDRDGNVRRQLGSKDEWSQNYYHNVSFKESRSIPFHKMIGRLDVTINNKTLRSPDQNHDIMHRYSSQRSQRPNVSRYFSETTVLFKKLRQEDVSQSRIIVVVWREWFQFKKSVIRDLDTSYERVEWEFDLQSKRSRVCPLTWEYEYFFCFLPSMMSERIIHISSNLNVLTKTS